MPVLHHFVILTTFGRKDLITSTFIITYASSTNPLFAHNGSTKPLLDFIHQGIVTSFRITESVWFLWILNIEYWTLNFEFWTLNLEFINPWNPCHPCLKYHIPHGKIIICVICVICGWKIESWTLDFEPWTLNLELWTTPSPLDYPHIPMERHRSVCGRW